MSHLLSILVVAGGIALLAWLCWPPHGVALRWLRALRDTERVQVEDALKHLWDCEYRDSPATLLSLSGALGVTGDRSAELVGRLQQLELMVSEDDRFKLTRQGRSDALRVIRIHRLWERYLSDETGLDAREWHVEAETREHTTTVAEAEEMAANLGHPRYDPHGDPIPTARGEVPGRRGEALSGLAEGQAGEIVHVEDEPSAVYAQLVAAGLHPGMVLRVLESSPQRVRIQTETDEHVLAPVVAANVAVVRLAEDEKEDSLPDGGLERLSILRPGEQGEVRGISNACRGPSRRRLLDLGVVPGTVVEAEMTSPGGDPTAYRVRGAMIALRRDQANHIHIRRLERTA